MPKSIIFLLFTLFVLRGQTNAQNCESLRPLYSVNYPSFCNAPATVTVTYPLIGGVTYTFRLDGVASATNTWQNVANGRHTIGYTGSNGCNKADTAIVLNSSILQLFAEQQPVTNCLDKYTWSDISQNVSVRDDMLIGIYTVTVTDANGCKISGSATLTTCVWQAIRTQVAWSMLPICSISVWLLANEERQEVFVPLIALQMEEAIVQFGMVKLRLFGQNKHLRA
jgi:hypothetical protein